MSNFWQNYSNGIGKTAFYLSIGPILGNKIGQNLFSFSFFDSECIFFGHVLKIFHRVCRNFIPRVQWNISMKDKFFQRKVYFYCFWTLIGGFLQLSRRKIGSVVKTTLYESKGCREKRFGENVFFIRFSEIER